MGSGVFILGEDLARKNGLIRKRVEEDKGRLEMTLLNLSCSPISLYYLSEKKKQYHLVPPSSHEIHWPLEELEANALLTGAESL